MRLLFITATRVPDVPSPLLVHVTDLLERRGHEIAHVTPEKVLTDVDRLVADHDLYLLKSHTELSLSIASALRDQGARLLNPYEACVAAQDKLRAHRRLAGAGVRVPRTYVAADYAQVVRATVSGRSLLLKPLRGHRGIGVEVVRDLGRLRDRPPPAGPLLVQELVAGTGEDLKVYVVGERVWAVRKPFSLVSFTRPGRPVAVSREVRDIALRVGRVTGLGLYGLDLIDSPDGPVVVDLNYFPGYKGCLGVAEPMAEYIDAYAHGRFELSPAMTADAGPGVSTAEPVPTGAW